MHLTPVLEVLEKANGKLFFSANQPTCVNVVMVIGVLGGRRLVVVSLLVTFEDCYWL